MENSTLLDQYDAKKIHVQEGLSAVRKRPGMYIGSIDGDGLHHLVYEIVDNAIDEALAGYCSQISITLHKDESITIKDDGRGIPFDTHSNGKSALEVVMTQLHAGGKFNNDVYKISGGLHGVGCAVVNALSSHCIARVHRNNKIVEQRYEKGEVITPITEIGRTDHTGTEIHFIPDKNIFTETHQFVFDKLSARFRELCYLINKITISIVDERTNPIQSHQFNSTDGLKDFIKFLCKDKRKLLKEPLFFSESSSKNGPEVDVALNYIASQDANILSFANSINTREGGTHLEGFKSALTRTCNKYLKQEDKLTRTFKESLQGTDVQAGLQAVLSLKHPDPTFSGQTKTRLSNTEVKGVVESSTTVALSNFFDHNPEERRLILSKCVQSALARIEGQKAIEKTLRKSVLGTLSLPGKLADCSEKDPEKCEIFLVEGDSAGGTAKLGRDRSTQAILPLWGKPLNVEKSQDSHNKIQNNEKLFPIIASLGCGIGPNIDLKKLRYSRIILMADADVDGSHIRTLLLTFFFRFMKPLIDEGHMYFAMPPLYKLSWNKKHAYAYDDDERETITASLLNEGLAQNKIAVQRYKGLGEMNADQLWDTTMNPETRSITKVNMDDSLLADKIFTLLMGEEVAPRKEFIESNALHVSNLDV